MKKIYTLLVFFLPLIGIAQPTISQSDLPGPGIGWLAIHNSSYSGTIPATGANVTWDYTSLTGTNDTTYFRSTAGSPYTATFPNATCVSYDASSDDWLYYTANSTGFYFDGGNTNGPFFNFNPGWLYVPVPFTYSDNRTNVARWVQDTVISGSNYRLIYNVTSTFVASGWGTVNTPSGSYPNTLLVKTTDVAIDSALLDPLKNGNYMFVQVLASDKQISYKWLRDNAATPLVLEIDADTSGNNTTKSSYLQSLFTVSTNDLPMADNSLSAYPNPASDIVHVNLNEKGLQTTVITVYNSLGQEIMNKEVKGSSVIDIPVAKFENGIYFYSFVSDAEKRSGKFSVVH